LQVRAVVIASLWPEAVERSPGNVPDRLDPEAASHLIAEGPELSTRLAERVLMVRSAGPEAAATVLAGRDALLPPALLLGGADLLRWGAGAAGELIEIEVFGVTRLPASVIRWWFQRVRGFEFDAPLALAEIEKMTAGVPLLLDLFEPRAARRDGPRRADGIDGGASAGAGAVRPGAGAGRRAGRCWATTRSCGCCPRERDLLFMVAAVSEENGYHVPDMTPHLTADWEYYQEACKVRAFDPSGEDGRSLELLQLLGLLPVRAEAASNRPLERQAAVPMADPLWRILSTMRSKA